MGAGLFYCLALTNHRQMVYNTRVVGLLLAEAVNYSNSSLAAGRRSSFVYHILTS